MNSDMYVDKCIPATQVDLYCNTLKDKTGLKKAPGS